MIFFVRVEETRLRIWRRLLAVFLYNQCFSSVTMPASLLYQASILKESSFACVSFETLNGIINVRCEHGVELVGRSLGPSDFSFIL